MPWAVGRPKHTPLKLGLAKNSLILFTSHNTFNQSMSTISFVPKNLIRLVGQLCHYNLKINKKTFLFDSVVQLLT